MHCGCRHISITIYMCHIVTKPENLIKLFVNELAAPTCVQDSAVYCSVGTCVITATISVIENYFNFISSEIQN
jgi:hypothetical protein